MNDLPHIPLTNYKEYPAPEMKRRAREFYEDLKRRRSLRAFSPRLPPISVIEDAIKTAGTAPNGANMQPWHFVVVTDKEVKKKIREAAEAEERAFYQGRASDEWLEALAPLGTDADKPFLETAPFLIVIFQQAHSFDAESNKVKHYYVKESVGIATGFLIAALHHAGLATLTHTPSPMGFLGDILGRPRNERAEMILVAGYPAEDATVPNITKKPFEEICSFV